MQRISIYLLATALALASCKQNNNTFDASGTFEAKEIIVSSEVTGKIISFEFDEGDPLNASMEVLKIDPLSLPYQKAQLEAMVDALPQKTMDAQPQISILDKQIESQQVHQASQQVQKEYLESEIARTKKLIEADAAIPQQLDKLNNELALISKQIEASSKQIEVLQQQIVSQKETVAIQNRAIYSEQEAMLQQIANVDDLIKRSTVINPISGTLITKYVNAGEFVNPGKALYKMADLSEMTLRAYISGSQLSEIQLGQKIKVYIDQGADEYKAYEGMISWISDKAEFTPKTIQTKDERAELVYAMKVRVPNDGSIKIGMYGELIFEEENRS